MDKKKQAFQENREFHEEDKAAQELLFKGSMKTFFYLLVAVVLGSPWGTESQAAEIPVQKFSVLENYLIRQDHVVNFSTSLQPESQQLIQRHVAELGTVTAFVETWVEKRYQGTPFQKQARAISRQILGSSESYRLDPLFLMAVIQNESSFNPKAIGTSGEIGLMQLMPDTAAWLVKKLKLGHLLIHGKKQKTSLARVLADPVKNIQIGSAYLDYLRAYFTGESRLYLSAYNMGIGNVQKLLANEVVPDIYNARVLRFYQKFYTQAGSQQVAPKSLRS